MFNRHDFCVMKWAFLSFPFVQQLLIKLLGIWLELSVVTLKRISASPKIMPIHRTLLALTLLAATLPAEAQRRRPPRNDGSQTPRTVEESIKAAEEKEREREAALRTGWNDAQDHHFRNQDKATRKRMRQNERRRKRMQQGRQVPWWRRIFGRKNRYR